MTEPNCGNCPDVYNCPIGYNYKFRREKCLLSKEHVTTIKYLKDKLAKLGINECFAENLYRDRAYIRGD